VYTGGDGQCTGALPNDWHSTGRPCHPSRPWREGSYEVMEPSQSRAGVARRFRASAGQADIRSLTGSKPDSGRHEAGRSYWAKPCTGGNRGTLNHQGHEATQRRNFRSLRVPLCPSWLIQYVDLCHYAPGHTGKSIAGISSIPNALASRKAMVRIASSTPGEILGRS